MTDTFTQVDNYLLYSDGRITDIENKNVTEIYLEGCLICDDDVKAIATALKKIERLFRLILQKISYPMMALKP